MFGKGEKGQLVAAQIKANWIRLKPEQIPDALKRLEESEYKEVRALAVTLKQAFESENVKTG